MFPPKWQQKCIMDDRFSELDSVLGPLLAYCMTCLITKHKHTRSHASRFQVKWYRRAVFCLPHNHSAVGHICHWPCHHCDRELVITGGHSGQSTLYSHPSFKENDAPAPAHRGLLVVSGDPYKRCSDTSRGHSHKRPQISLVKEHSHTVTTGVCHTPICFHSLVHLCSYVEGLQQR